ncbi:hypothetical protein GDO86_017499 [Hymenochirus boettgeri]|uniref:Uncharacterized protein n=1 Tax=Hymenochirus boettgeri TaxID=247094 RepID=A0A8T2IK96_9PIPI|nr:hypothetical protein GDO86_017499 [Hymenochirus boettgeri]
MYTFTQQENSCCQDRISTPLSEGSIIPRLAPLAAKELTMSLVKKCSRVLLHILPFCTKILIVWITFYLFFFLNTPSQSLQELFSVFMPPAVKDKVEEIEKGGGKV